MKFQFEKEGSKKLKEEAAKVEIVPGKDVKVIERDKKKVISFGIDSREEMTLRKFIILVRRIVSTAKANKIKIIAVDLKDFIFPKTKRLGAFELGSLFAQNAVMADFEFNDFKTPPKEGWDTLEEVVVLSGDAETKKGFEKGIVIGEEVNKCRGLANTPGGDMTPEILAKKAKEASKGLPISVTILGEPAMKKLGMGAVLGVGKGSLNSPKFIILEYKGGPKNSAPIVLVGKGVTFDTGGLSLKPADSMLEMHMDMSGGASVIHTITLAARLKIKKNVVGLVPAVENMPGGQSYRPGDILKSLSGKTIEVLNTDAEGRIILADALTYAEKYKPRLVVDVATLTGASLIALGQVASAIMTKDEKLETLFQNLGEESGEYVWPLPLWDEYEENVKGNFADFSNIPAKGNTRYAGVINGGMFLYQFAKNYPWVHIDMAPRMTSAEGDYLSKGAAGSPVRLLLRLIEKY